MKNVTFNVAFDAATGTVLGQFKTENEELNFNYKLFNHASIKIDKEDATIVEAEAAPPSRDELEKNSVFKTTDDKKSRHGVDSKKLNTKVKVLKTSAETVDKDYPMEKSYAHKIRYLIDKHGRFTPLKALSLAISRNEGIPFEEASQKATATVYNQVQQKNLVSVKFGNANNSTFFGRSTWVKFERNARVWKPENQPSDADIASIPAEKRIPGNMDWKGL
ncbi:MAG: hypothetical protein H0W61_05385 [Bacteroidetes bacterium]|nr:hypothetical protein [Bacteroidota bacterium]